MWSKQIWKKKDVVTLYNTFSFLYPREGDEVVYVFKLDILFTQLLDINRVGYQYIEDLSGDVTYAVVVCY